MRTERVSGPLYLFNNNLTFVPAHPLGEVRLATQPHYALAGAQLGSYGGSNVHPFSLALTCFLMRANGTTHQRGPRPIDSVLCIMPTRLGSRRDNRVERTSTAENTVMPPAAAST